LWGTDHKTEKADVPSWERAEEEGKMVDPESAPIPGDQSLESNLTEPATVLLVIMKLNM
jgi:hypothetical protein